MLSRHPKGRLLNKPLSLLRRRPLGRLDITKPLSLLHIVKPITSILVIKHKRLLLLKSGDQIIKSYSISLGKNPVGKKEFEGDEKTPEGNYTIYHKSEQSEFYKSLGISYPNAEEKELAESQGKLAGGQIRIHGFKNDFEGDQVEGKKKDWTAGCIAVTNVEMDEIYGLVEVGIPIKIEP